MWWAFIKNNFLASLLILAGCTGPKPPKDKLTLLLASSLMPLANAIQAAVPADTKLNLSFLSSATIAKQIEHGVPCQGAILASTEWYTYLHARKLVQGPPILVASNQLVLASTDSTSTSSLKTELLRAKKIIVGDEGYVPLGVYTEQVFSALKIKSELSDKLIKAASARQAVIMLEQKAATLAILFASDVAASPNIFTAHPIDEALHQRIIYPLFSCTTPQDPAFIRIVQIFSQPSVQRALTNLGFNQP